MSHVSQLKKILKNCMSINDGAVALWASFPPTPKTPQYEKSHFYDLDMGYGVYFQYQKFHYSRDIDSRIDRFQIRNKSMLDPEDLEEFLPLSTNLIMDHLAVLNYELKVGARPLRNNCNKLNPVVENFEIHKNSRVFLFLITSASITSSLT